MRLLSRRAILGAVVGLLALGALGSRGLGKASDARRELTRWEYKVIDFAADGPDKGRSLDDLGKEGWELVAVAANQAGRPQVFYLKRPR